MVDGYLTIGVLIGAVLIIDGLLLRKSQGKWGGNRILAATTSIELIWALVSLAAVFTLKFPGWTLLIPSLYIAHNVFGWLYGFYLAAKTQADTPNFYVSMWYVNFGIQVGFIYSILCIVALTF
jgi:hypothetical protein